MDFMNSYFNSCNFNGSMEVNFYNSPKQVLQVGEDAVTETAGHCLTVETHFINLFLYMAIHLILYIIVYIIHLELLYNQIIIR